MIAKIERKLKSICLISNLYSVFSVTTFFEVVVVVSGIIFSYKIYLLLLEDVSVTTVSEWISSTVVLNGS